MTVHKKFFPVTKMPWHTDDHEFGEGTDEMTWDDVAKKFVPIFEELEEDWRQVGEALSTGAGIDEPLPAPPIDPTLAGIDERYPAVAFSTMQPPSPWEGKIATVCLVDEGKCYMCGDRAVYGFRSKLYCPTCWLELQEDFD